MGVVTADVDIVELVDVTPRDGLQNDPGQVSTDDKLAMVEHSIAAGIRAIEVTSFTHPKRVPKMADAEELCARLPDQEGVRYAGLVLNQRGYDRALATGRLQEVTFVVCATDTFGQRNQGQTVSDGLAFARELADQARRDGMGLSVTIALSFGCPFEGEVPPSRVVSVAEALADIGVDELILADTIGVAVPQQVRGVIEGVRAAVGRSLRLRAHFHNTRNTGVANVTAAIACGVRRFDGTFGGIGGCPFAPDATGNVALEDVAYLFERSGFACAAPLSELIEVSRFVSSILGRPLPGALARAGAFPGSGA